MNISPDIYHQLSILASQDILSDQDCLYLEFGKVDYEIAWELQKYLVNARYEGSINTDIIMLLEHSPVFTIGKRGNRDSLRVSEEFLKNNNTPVIHVERGGDITYHGPGQVIVYPIIHLEKARIGVKDYVAALEEMMIQTADDWGICAERHSKNHGVWVNNKKLGSVGITVRRGICFHGLALNVNMSLEPFTWINPCGLKDVKVTSMAKESDQSIVIKDVRNSLRKHMENVLNVKLNRILSQS